MNNSIELNEASVEQIAVIFGCTVDRLHEQYRKNARQLTNMAEKAKTTGRKVNGYTEQQLRELVKKINDKVNNQ